MRAELDGEADAAILDRELFYIRERHDVRAEVGIDDLLEGGADGFSSD
jgi:hypothetical protein